METEDNALSCSSGIEPKMFPQGLKPCCTDALMSDLKVRPPMPSRIVGVH